MSIVIFAEIYSAQLDEPIETCVSNLSEVIDLIDGLPENIYFDFYLDCFSEECPTLQESYSALGQSSKQAVKEFVSNCWLMINLILE